MHLIKRRWRIPVIVGAAVVAVAAGTSVALASIPDSNGVIHACYQSPPPAHGANLQVIDTGNGGSCSGGMVALNWNQTGPQGPTGATGATGATGPQGPAGPSTGGSSGLDLQIIVAQNSLSNGVWSPNPLTAQCPTGHPFLFGGGTPTGSTVSYPDSAPSASESETGTGPHGWTVSSGANNQLTVYAICGK